MSPTPATLAASSDKTRDQPRAGISLLSRSNPKINHLRPYLLLSTTVREHREYKGAYRVFPLPWLRFSEVCRYQVIVQLRGRLAGYWRKQQVLVYTLWAPRARGYISLRKNNMCTLYGYISIPTYSRAGSSRDLRRGMLPPSRVGWLGIYS